MDSLRRAILLICIALVLMLPMAAKGGNSFVVVLDAGHGGHDPGTVGNFAKEKDINLAVVRGVGELIKKGNSDVKVVYTRDGDYFRTLQERCDIANSAGGSLFISVHVNSVERTSRNRTSVHGAATYTLGLHRSADNLDVARRENAVMMLEDDYTERYCGFDPNSSESYIIFELNQNTHMDQSIDFAGRVQRELHRTADRVDNGVRQAGFWVLAKTGMPSVLVELDFICNPTSEEYLASDKGQAEMSQAIYDAFAEYKRNYDNRGGRVGGPTSTSVASAPVAKSKPAAKVVARPDSTPRVDSTARTESKPQRDDSVVKPAGAASEVTYSVQFIISPRKLPEGSPKFKGVTVDHAYCDDGTWKYASGVFPTARAARECLESVRRQFPDAFIVKIADGKRVK